MINLIINPGTGKVPEGTKEQSEINIKQFITDLKVKAVYEFKLIDSDGRHDYDISFEGEIHEVSMPPIPLENVRYIDPENQSILNFPRLYVDGSSWVWKYALDMCFRKDKE